MSRTFTNPFVLFCLFCANTTTDINTCIRNTTTDNNTCIRNQSNIYYQYKLSLMHSKHVFQLMLNHFLLLILYQKLGVNIMHRKHLFIPPPVFFSLCLDCRSISLDIEHNMQVFFYVYTHLFHQRYFINYISNI